MKSGWISETSGWNLCDIWDICFENEGNTSFVYTTCTSADVLINDGAKTLTRNVQSNEKINNSSVYLTVYATVASKTRILKTAMHRHAVSDADVFFFIDWTWKKRLMRRLFGTSGGARESNDFFFFCLIMCFSGLETFNFHPWVWKLLGTLSN